MSALKMQRKGKSRGWGFPCVSQTDSWAQGQRWSGDGLWPLLPETLASYLGIDKKWNKLVAIGSFMLSLSHGRDVANRHFLHVKCDKR